MAKVFQLSNGAWGFRYTFVLDGKQKDIKRTRDENGNPFKTERAAIKAREAAIIKVQTELLQPQKSAGKRMTVAEVFNEYCETGRCSKAYGTRLAEQNLPAHLLCNQMEHAGSRVTEKYYIAISGCGTEIIKDKVEAL